MVSSKITKGTFSYRTFKIKISLGGERLDDNKIPNKVAEYFKNGTKKITKVIPNDDYTLTVVFDNNEPRLYDLSDSLYGVFEVLKDKNKFREVFIDESGNIAWDKDKNIDSSEVWSDRIDICKDSIYLDSIPVVS